MTNFDHSLGTQYTLRLRVTLASQNTANNTSTVNWALYAIKNSGSGYWTNSAKGYGWNIGGNAGSSSRTYDFRNYTTLTVRSGSYTITHDDDGTKSISVSGYFNPDNAPALANDSTSGTYTLPTIPRASTPTLSAASFDAGTSVTIDMNRASTDFTHTVEYSFGGLTDESIATGVETSTTWTPPMSMLNQIPSAVSGSGSVKVKTYNGGTLLGEKTVGFTLIAPSSVIPTISSVTVAEATTSPDVDTIVGGYVQSISKLAIAIVGDAGAYGSTIVSRKITVNSQIINAASGTTTQITTSGTVAIITEVTDTRGRKSSFANTDITVLAYAKPVATTVEARRALVGGGVDQSEGTYIRVDMAATASSLIVGTQKNLLEYRISTSPYDTDTWTVRVAATSSGASTLAYNSYGGSNPYVLVTAGNPYAVNASFDVKVEVIDKLTQLPFRVLWRPAQS